MSQKQTSTNFSVKDSNKKRLVKFLGIDLYENQFAGFDELFTNARAATKKAKNQFGVTPHIEIIVEEGHFGVTLTIRDNGIGMDRDKINVLESIAESPTAQYESLTGNFGIGFFASLGLSKVSGVFSMRSHSRETENSDIITGLWSLDGFDDTVNPFTEQWSDEKYGTEFQILAPDIEFSEFTSYIKETIKYVEVPVTLEERPDTGETKTTTFGDTPLCAKYPNNESMATFDFGEFKLHFSPDASGHAYLNKIPIETSNQIYSTNWPYFNVDLEMFIEKRKVFRGPNAGKYVFEDAGFVDEHLDESEWILEKDLTDDDIEYPAPSGTRETIQVSDEFIEFIKELASEFIQYCFESYNSRLETYTEDDDFKDVGETFTKADICMIGEASVIPSYTYESDKKVYDKDKLTAGLDHYINGTWNEGFLNLVQALQTEVTVRYQDNKRSRKQKERLYSAIQDRGNIYLCLSENELKKEVVFDLERDAVVVSRLPNASYYDWFTHLDGVSKLSSITKSVMMEAELSSSVQEKVDDKYSEDTTEEAKENEQVVVRYGNRTKKMSVKELEHEVSAVAHKDYAVKFYSNTLTYLVYFTENSSEQIRDYTSMRNSHIGIVRIDEEFTNEIQQYDGVLSIDEMKEEATNYTFPTNRCDEVGITQEIPNPETIENVVIIPHYIDAETKQTMMEYLPYLLETADRPYELGASHVEETALHNSYMFVTPSESLVLCTLYSDIKSFANLSGHSDRNILPRDTTSSGDYGVYDTTVCLFKQMVERGYKTATDEYLLKNATEPLNEGGAELIETMENTVPK